MSAPYIHKELITFLEHSFPDTLPRDEQTDLARLNQLIGEQTVIDFLRAEYIIQEETRDV